VSAAAWLLDLDGGCSAAVGAREQLHLVHAPRVHEVPSAPRWCRHVLILGDRCIPVFDVSILLGAAAGAHSRKLLGIYGYSSDAAVDVALGALWLGGPPRMVQVDDDAACPLPEPAAAWGTVAHSCFTHEGRAVPILDLGAIFRERRASRTSAVMAT
jgi:chemotaxis signal transduction protein